MGEYLELMVCFHDIWTGMITLLKPTWNLEKVTEFKQIQNVQKASHSQTDLNKQS